MNKQEKIDKLERDRKILEMRRRGCDYDKIASEIKVNDASYAAKLGKKAIEKYKRKCEEDASALVTLQKMQINDVINANYPAAMNGDPKAAQVIIAAMKRLAELMGLDAPTKHEHSGDIHIFPPAKSIEAENA